MGETATLRERVHRCSAIESLLCNSDLTIIGTSVVFQHPIQCWLSDFEDFGLVDFRALQQKVNSHDNCVDWRRLAVAPWNFKEMLIFHLSTLPVLLEEHQ